MANTYTQLYYQAVFVVEKREALLQKTWRSRLFEYIAGIMRAEGCKVLAVNGVEDHIHIFFSCDPDTTISKLLQTVKGRSSAWINSENLISYHFNWQRGFAAFTYGKSAVPTVVAYIMNQEEHHKKTSFKEEYVGLLKEYGIDYDERYIFKEPW